MCPLNITDDSSVADISGAWPFLCVFPLILTALRGLLSVLFPLQVGGVRLRGVVAARKRWSQKRGPDAADARSKLPQSPGSLSKSLRADPGEKQRSLPCPVSQRGWKGFQPITFPQRTQLTEETRGAPAPVEGRAGVAGGAGPWRAACC